MSDLLVPRSDVSEFRRRYKWLALFVFIAFLVVVGRLVHLQIVNGAEYAAIAHENIIRRVTLSTTRGEIHDANGETLAGSRPSHSVYIVPGRVMASARPPRYRHGERVVDDPDTFPRIAEVIRLNPEERARIEERIRAACTTDEDKSPCWRPILVREDVARDIVAELRQHQDELAGAEVATSPVRFYPHKNLGSHMLGYVAEIDGEALAKLKPVGVESMSPEEREKLNPLSYEAGDHLGATGVEHAWESHLRGKRGWKKEVVDARGRYRTGPAASRLLDPPYKQEEIPGRNLRLTVDIELEREIEKAMFPHVSGAVVVVEVRTGRLLALYSKPDFDPNDLSGGKGRARVRETFNQLYANPYRPMLDKTMSGAFQPGSTFKPFAAMAALETRSVRPEEYQRCDGYIAFGREIKRCSHVHGAVAMREAIAQSCNVYFFRLAEATGMDPMSRVAHDFGLGERAGIGVNPEAAGRVPTRAWYTLRYHARYFRKGFTLHAAIGQGDVTVTPLQLALGYATIANGGTLYQPQLVRAVEMRDGSVVQEFPPRVRRQVQVKQDTLTRVHEGMYDVVNEERGTVFPWRDAALDVSGKTGTAQPGHIARADEEPKIAAWRSQNHAWFAAFSPSKSPDIAVVVLVEHGVSGPEFAAPVALKVIREYNRIQAARAAGRAPGKTDSRGNKAGPAGSAPAGSKHP